MKALITGISGQDGSFLAELLLQKGYEVYGVTRENSDLKRIKDFKEKLSLTTVDLQNYDSLKAYCLDIMPNEIYHLASDVDPLLIPEKTTEVFKTNFVPGMNLLNIIQGFLPMCRLYFAGSSLMFGDTKISPQNEETPMNPTTPYGIAKVATHNFLKMYRETFGIYACTGILYNHESTRRAEHFLPRKITTAVAKIKSNKQETLKLGTIDVNRDWSHAKDIVRSMWLMLQQETPKDYVIGSGVLHSAKDVLKVAFSTAGLEWLDYVETDEVLVRNVDYFNLCADITKARSDLKWVPHYSFEEIIEEMTLHDIKELK